MMVHMSKRLKTVVSIRIAVLKIALPVGLSMPFVGAYWVGG